MWSKQFSHLQEKRGGKTTKSGVPGRFRDVAGHSLSILSANPRFGFLIDRAPPHTRLCYKTCRVCIFFFFYVYIYIYIYISKPVPGFIFFVRFSKTRSIKRIGSFVPLMTHWTKELHRRASVRCARGRCSLSWDKKSFCAAKFVKALP